MTYTAASHQGAIGMLWLHFGELSCRPSLFTLMFYIQVKDFRQKYLKKIPKQVIFQV